MKKQLLFYAFILLSTAINAYDAKIDGIYYNFSGDEATVTYQKYENSKYISDYSGAIVIPASVTYNGKTYSVTGIVGEAFHDCTSLTSITIPNSVTKIAAGAFSGCSGLTSITIPNSVTDIGQYAFKGCSGLTSVTIPNSVTYIGDGVFWLCRSLTSVTIPNSVTSIPRLAFCGCTNLTSVTIHNRVTSIGEYAFRDCTSLTSITIPVAHILRCAFLNCASLSSITITNGVGDIGEYAFGGCSNLSTVILDSNAIVSTTGSFKKGVFGEQVKTYVIGDNISSIGDDVFSGCSGMTSVTIGKGVTSIGNNTFSGCSSLTTVILESNSIVSTTGSFKKGVFGEQVKTYVIGGNVSSIGNYAFYGCSGLTSVNIPEGVTSIGNSAFSGCSGLTSVNIPEGVTSIGNSAFTGCSGLTSVNIGNGVIDIGTTTFSGCSGLISVTIGNNVRRIDRSAFYNCTGITDIYCYAETVPTIYSTISSSYNFKLQNITLHVPNCSIGLYKNSPWSESRSIVGLYGSEHVLTYILDGDVYKTYNLWEDQPIIPEGAPQNVEGYTFSGWDELPATMPTHDVTVTGTFIPNSYTLTYKVDGEVYMTTSVVYGTTPTPEPIPIKEGYTFSGWSGLPETMPAHDVVVTGTFSINSYILTYKVDGEVYKTFSVVYGATLSAIAAPTKEGHTFSGWTGLPATMPAHDVEVTGTFTANPYVLTYKVDGVVYKTFTVIYGTALTPEPAPTKEGHTFSGWNGLPATMPARNVTVTGSFTANSYILTYKVDGAVYKSFSVTYGTALTPIAAPTKEGHTFSGWNGLPASMPAHNVEVTGSFNVNSYTLTYKVDGNIYKTFYVPYGTAITPLEAPVKKGMTFSGWGNVPETMPARDLTLNATYAWSKETVDGVIYQVADTINNYVAVIGNDNISGGAEILQSIEIGGDDYIVNIIGNNAFYNCRNLTAITIPGSVTAIGNSTFYGCNNINFYVNRGSYALLYVWNHYGYDPYEIGTSQRLTRPSISVISTTQTSITYQINNIYPDLEYNYVYNEAINEDKFRITGLRPQYTQPINLTVLSANNSYSTSTNATTSPISPSVTYNEVTASSISAKGSYLEGDSRVVSTLLTMNGTNMDGVEGKLHGLKPNTSYNCKYVIVVEYGNGSTYSYEDSRNIKTAVLNLATQQPKVISVGNVIVSANSNLDDEETNIGFEWRRTDWTDEFTSNSGVAYLYEGTMEGYIRNLYTEKLWKYRPYYQSDSGNRYYGEWVGIDPTNTSYFEPTVHTYAQINVTGNRAEIKGYAMRGTDNVTSQGFMYWQNNTSVSLRKRATSVPSGATVVNASGNIMTATLEGLEYETTYNYVAFVTTSEGETFYGELQTFSTDADPDDIEGVKASEEVVEVARYDLQGRMIAKPQKGINIIRYSNGTSKKVIVK